MKIRKMKNTITIILTNIRKQAVISKLFTLESLLAEVLYL